MALVVSRGALALPEISAYVVEIEWGGRIRGCIGVGKEIMVNDANGMAA